MERERVLYKSQELRYDNFMGYLAAEHPNIFMSMVHLAGVIEGRDERINKWADVNQVGEAMPLRGVTATVGPIFLSYLTHKVRERWRRRRG